MFDCHNLKIFNNFKIEKCIYFNKVGIVIVDANNDVLEEYIFKPYGNSVWNKYNERGILVYSMELIYPHTIIKKDIKYNIVDKTIISLDDDSIKKERINLYGYGVCIIS